MELVYCHVFTSLYVSHVSFCLCLCLCFIYAYPCFCLCLYLYIIVSVFVCLFFSFCLSLYHCLFLSLYFFVLSCLTPLSLALARKIIPSLAFHFHIVLAITLRCNQYRALTHLQELHLVPFPSLGSFTTHFLSTISFTTCRIVLL